MKTKMKTTHKQEKTESFQVQTGVRAGKSIPESIMDARDDVQRAVNKMLYQTYVSG